jgi:hypothetical protein
MPKFESKMIGESEEVFERLLQLILALMDAKGLIECIILVN